MTRHDGEISNVRDGSAAMSGLEETLQWIKDWREGMFSSTSRDREGWPIEMHGLVASYEELAEAYKALAVRHG